MKARHARVLLDLKPARLQDFASISASFFHHLSLLLFLPSLHYVLFTLTEPHCLLGKWICASHSGPEQSAQPLIMTPLLLLDIQYVSNLDSLMETLHCPSLLLTAVEGFSYKMSLLLAGSFYFATVWCVCCEISHCINS